MPRSPSLATILAAIALVAACVQEPQTAPELARGDGGGSGGAGGGSQTAEPEILAVDPDTVPRDTTVSIRILGAGFDRGSVAEFGIDEVADSRMRVNFTTYKRSTELIANVTVAPDAELASYDVMVTTKGGKKGIGSEKLLVVEANATAFRAFPLDDSGLAIRSDGAFALGGESYYRDGECGVKGTIFLANGGGDHILQTDNPRERNQKCADYPRRATVVYPDGRTETAPFRSNLHTLQNATFRIPRGDTRKRSLTIDLALSGARCDALRYSAVTLDGQPAGGDSVNVRRIDARTWDVWNEPGSSLAYCVSSGASSGALFAMPVRFRIIASRDLPE